MVELKKNEIECLDQYLYGKDLTKMEIEGFYDLATKLNISVYELINVINKN
jgi:hypothetical protein